jgi:preprotein translocase subunit SecA
MAQIMSSALIIYAIIWLKVLEQMVQRGHYFAIVDEVDSILIDEARTPLIISAPDAEPTKKYFEFAKLVDTLTKGTDYALDEKLRSVTLTDYGLRRLERRLGVDNLYEKDYDSIHHMEQALKAKTLFNRDKDYVVKDGQVIIVDEHTGRLMFGRRYSEGLHQAIEAKENVTIQQESRTLATISLQNYFRMYEKLAGMTGTASTEAEEFRSIYKMEVVVVPTNRDVVRKDAPDIVYKTKRAKFGAIVKEVKENLTLVSQCFWAPEVLIKTIL